MLDDFVYQFMPRIAEIFSYLIVFLIGFQLVEIKGGIPFVNGLFVARMDSLILLGGGSLFLLFVVEPAIEIMLLGILYEYVGYTIPLLVLLCGLAILKFDQTMRWDYSKYGYFLVIIGIVLLLNPEIL